MRTSVCAVIVTHNRKELLYRNISAILEQTYPVDILIYDNNSIDGTKLYLKEKGVIGRSNVQYIYSKKNIGGAGGFSRGLKIAYRRGYEWFWLMDDDGYCYNSETLKELMLHLPDETDTYILNSTVVCNDNLELTFGFLNIDNYEKLLDEANEGVYEGYINPFNSTLISRACIERIGYPIGAFFLYGDEHEYMLRALKNKIAVRTIADSLYYHPVNRTIRYKNLMGINIPVKDEPIWKSYCDARNSIYISKKYESHKMLLIRIMILLAAPMYKNNSRLKTLKYVFLGIVDGYKEYFSRPLMFNA